MISITRYRDRGSWKSGSATTIYGDEISLNGCCTSAASQRVEYGRGLVMCEQQRTCLQDIFTPSLPMNYTGKRNLSRDSGIFLADRHSLGDSGSSAGSVSCIHTTKDRHHPSERRECEPIDSTLKSWELPSAAHQIAIIQQVEYYFSDDYLSRDAYFLRQNRRKKEGYLSMRLITNFKKLRKLVKDPRVTAYCLRKSKLLRVNEEGTKVKRVQDVPQDLKRFQPQNSVLVLGIPERLAKIEAVMNIFYKCGDMTSVRLLRPGKECPIEILEHMEKRKDKAIWTRVNAVIEYEKAEYAMAACRLFHTPNNAYGISEVSLLTTEPRVRKNQYKGRRNPKAQTENASGSMPAKSYDWRKTNVIELPRKSDASKRNDPTPSHGRIDSCYAGERDENISDNAWIQDVVNQVLKQTYHSSKILSDYRYFEEDNVDASYPDFFEGDISPIAKTKDDYSKLHADTNSKS